MSHVFISYSHQDEPYVLRLSNELKRCDIDVWTDRNILPADQWPIAIERAVKGCFAMIVVMTPAALESEWVKKEIEVAQTQRKLLFPLLLEGDEFESLKSYQYVDVTNRHLPPPSFYCQLVRTGFHINSFYTQRGESSTLTSTFDLVRQDILVVGITLRKFILGCCVDGGWMDEMLSRGCTIRLLFLSPYTLATTDYTTRGERNPVMFVSNRQTLDNLTFENAIDFLSDVAGWKKQLAPERQERLEIRGYDNIPATGAILIDAMSGLDTAMIHTEPTMAEMSADMRPSFDISRRSSPAFFGTLFLSYRRLWGEAEDAETILAMHRAWLERQPSR